MPKVSKKTESFELREVKKIERELNLYPRLTTFERLCAVSDRLAWLYKFRKLPAPILDALIEKITALFDGSWYGDEPAQTVIDDFLKGGSKA